MDDDVNRRINLCWRRWSWSSADVSAKEEIGGLDLYEHNLVSAYAGFDFADHTADEYIAENSVFADTASAAKPAATAAPAVPAAMKPAETHSGDKPKLTKVVIVINRNKF